MSDEKLLAVLREKVPDVTEREAELFAHLWRVWPHLSANLIHLPSGKLTRDVINEWVGETYGLQFREREKR